MRVTAKKLASLALAALLCAGAALCIRFWGVSKTAEEKQPEYYYTTYTDPSRIFAIELSKDKKDLVLARVDGKYMAYGDIEAEADQDAADTLFYAACQVPLTKKLEGASSADSQFGLGEGAAEILIMDTDENPHVFVIGNATPDGSGYYSCLYKDERVFVMDRKYADIFLSDHNMFYDLSIYPAIDPSELKSVTVSDGENVLYRLDAARSSDGAFYFEMKQPAEMLLSLEQSQKLLTQLKNPKAKSISKMSAKDWDELEKIMPSFRRLTLTKQGNNSYTVDIVFDKETAYVHPKSSDQIYEIPAGLLDFANCSADALVGDNLLTLNLSELVSLDLNGKIWTVEDTDAGRVVKENGVSTDSGAFRDSVLYALNHISVQAPYTGQTIGSKILSMDLLTNIIKSPMKFTFYETDSGKAVVSVNGTPAFVCGSAALAALKKYL